MKRDSVGNVIGEIGRGKPVILLCGHMDTVAGYIPVLNKDNKLYCRGSVDAKASLAAMIVAASTFAVEGNSAEIIVAGVVDEEEKSRGVKNLLKEGITTDYAIFGEPSGVEKITIGYKGNLRLKITVKTRAGHSSAPMLYENAVEKAFKIWREIQKIHFPSEKPESPFYSLTSSITKIEGGRGDSTMPFKCQIHIDMRIPPQLTSTQLFNEVCKLIGHYQKVNPKISIKTKIKDSVEPFEADQNSLLVQALSRSIREVRHKTATLTRKTGTGDMNIFGRTVKIPVVTYGPGIQL